jgi:Family of unknown function (DUF6521)
LIWQFGLGFQADDGQRSSFLLAFLVLPLLLHRPTLELVSSTRKSSGLSLFAAKIGEEHENLLAVHSRALALRKLSLESMALAANRGLITVDYNGGLFRSNTTQMKAPSLPERIRSMTPAARRLGFWFTQMSVHQIASTLRVQF